MVENPLVQVPNQLIPPNQLISTPSIVIEYHRYSGWLRNPAPVENGGVFIP